MIVSVNAQCLVIHLLTLYVLSTFRNESMWENGTWTITTVCTFCKVVQISTEQDSLLNILLYHSHYFFKVINENRSDGNG